MKLLDQDTLFPNEHDVQNDENQFMKPAAGITGVTSETDGTLGVIKKTNVILEISIVISIILKIINTKLDLLKICLFYWHYFFCL